MKLSYEADMSCINMSCSDLKIKDLKNLKEKEEDKEAHVRRRLFCVEHCVEGKYIKWYYYMYMYYM